MKKFLISALIFLLLTVPIFSFAQQNPPAWGGLIPCSNTAEVDPSAVTPKGKCDFNAFMKLIDNIIKFLLFTLAIPIAAIMFFYAGLLLVTAGEETASARTKAKGIFTNAVFGLVLAAAAWLIIRTILSILGYQGDWIGFPSL